MSLVDPDDFYKEILELGEPESVTLTVITEDIDDDIYGDSTDSEAVYYNIDAMVVFDDLSDSHEMEGEIINKRVTFWFHPDVDSYLDVGKDAQTQITWNSENFYVENVKRHTLGGVKQVIECACQKI